MYIAHRAGRDATTDGLVNHRHWQVVHPYVVAIAGAVLVQQTAVCVVAVALADTQREARTLADALPESVVRVGAYRGAIALHQGDPVAIAIAEGFAAHHAAGGVAVGVVRPRGGADAGEPMRAVGVEVRSSR